MRFTLEDIEKVPDNLWQKHEEERITPQEVIARIARYLVMESLRLPFTDEAKIQIARSEYRDFKNFGKSVTTCWALKYGDREGIAEADVETEAVMLGLDEDIWPVEPEAERQAHQKQTYSLPQAVKRLR